MSEVKTNNTIAGLHIRKFRNGEILELSTSNLYHWNIPKRLRSYQIQKGDIVMVYAKDKRALVLVMDVFREEFEETNRWYKKIIKLVNRKSEK